MVVVSCLLVVGDHAEFIIDGGDAGDVARWPAAAVAGEAGLEVAQLPGRRFRVRVEQPEGRVLFSGFSLLLR